MFNDPGDNIGPKSLRPLEAGDRGRERHGVRRRVLHARRGRVHHRGRARDVLRPARHLRHDRGVRADPHGRASCRSREIMRLSLLGNYERMSAQRAHQIGMVSEVVPGDRARRPRRASSRRSSRAQPRARDRRHRARDLVDAGDAAARGACASATRTSRWAPTRTRSPRARSCSRPASASSGSCGSGRPLAGCRGEKQNSSCAYQSWAASSSVASGSRLATSSSSSSGSRLS